LRIELGAEIRIGAELLDDLEATDKSGILPLGTSRYLLLEFGRQGPWIDSSELVHELRLRDWRPIFAHPEFAPNLASNLHLMKHLAEAGAFFQITAMSLTGAFGHQNRKLVRRMVDAGVIHFVASDAHDTRRRPPGLLTAHRDLAKHWGEEVAWELTLGNPRCVVDNKLIPTSRLV
jgi:protein-tyrosine phosphatase